MTSTSAVTSTGNAAVDQLISAAQAEIAASRAAYPTGGRLNSTITDNASDTLGSSAIAQLDRLTKPVITADGRIGGFLPSNYAPQIAKLQIESQLIQDFLLTNLGYAPDSPLKATSVAIDPGRGGFDLFM